MYGASVKLNASREILIKSIVCIYRHDSCDLGGGGWKEEGVGLDSYHTISLLRILNTSFIPLEHTK